jgi:quercetin dioxygenase-like cupin family protein
MLLSMLLFACAPKSVPPVEPAPAPAPVEETEVPTVGMVMTPAAEVGWFPMNPDAPDFGQLAVVRGNPQEGASTMLMRFPAGGIAGLHTHSNAYAAVVLGGSPIHGDSPEVATTFGPGGVWVQPGGEVHYDACAADSDGDCVFLLRWSGAQDYAPSEAPAEGETSWTPTLAADVAWTPMMEGGPELAVVHGDPQAGAATLLMRFPAGFQSGMHTHTAAYDGVVVSGAYQHGVDGAMTDLGPGSVWTQPGGVPHADSCLDEAGCIVALSFDGAMDFAPVGNPGE